MNLTIPMVISLNLRSVLSLAICLSSTYDYIVPKFGRLRHNEGREDQGKGEDWLMRQMQLGFHIACLAISLMWAMNDRLLLNCTLRSMIDFTAVPSSFRGRVPLIQHFRVSPELNPLGSITQQWLADMCYRCLSTWNHREGRNVFKCYRTTWRK